MTARFWLVLLIILLFGWGLYADYGTEIAGYFTDDEFTSIQEAGSWGDTFGAFNGLVSLAGAVFIVRTLILQQSALAEQQKAIILQISDSHRQRFEATFFELLKLLRELRGELRFKHSRSFINSASNNKIKLSRTSEKTGVDALSGFIIEHMDNLRQSLIKPQHATRSQLAQYYDTTMTNTTEKTFSPYFRMIYTILQRLRNDEILSDDEKISYSRLLRSQLTNTELLAISYNSLSKRSADMEILIVKYHMLKYMPQSAARSRFETIFDSQAFSARD